MKKLKKVIATRKIHKLHVGLNDKVLIIAGDQKGFEGLICDVDRKRFKVKVAGAKLMTHFLKSDNVEPGEKKIPKTEKIEGWIHVSNVKLLEKYTKGVKNETNN